MISIHKIMISDILITEIFFGNFRDCGDALLSKIILSLFVLFCSCIGSFHFSFFTCKSCLFIIANFYTCFLS